MEKFTLAAGLEPMDPQEVLRMAPIRLAYIGDAVYETYVRQYVLQTDSRRIHEVNQNTVRFVRASAQAYAIRHMEGILTEEEWAIVKKGRNQKSTSVPKNADVAEYRYATGFEALIGSLYLRRERERLAQIVSQAIFAIESREDA